VKKKLNRLWLLMIPFALSGCVAASTAPAVVSDYCRIATPLTYDSERDTMPTIKEIEAHNSKWVCVCENDCPNKTVVN